MNKLTQSFFKKISFPKWVKIVFGVLGGMFLLIVLLYIVLGIYVNSNKDELKSKLLTELNGGLSGEVTVKSMDPTFFTGFPNVSLRLQGVVLRDSLYKHHNRTLLKAGELDVAVNLMAFLRGAMVVRKINIRNAVIDMYTDASGYSNSAIFRKKDADEPKGEGSFPELRHIVFEDVTMGIEDLQNFKKYKFTFYNLDSDIDYTLSGWEAVINIDAFAHSMAFNTVHGSFIKDKTLDGKFELSYNEDDGFVTAKPNTLSIGGDDFVIGAKMKLGSEKADFTFNISNESILWRNASHLLSPNISKKLDMFNLEKPIRVKCDLIGDFNAKGDPSIFVKAEIRDNVLHTPGGIVNDCSFTGVFTLNIIISKDTKSEAKRS